MGTFKFLQSTKVQDTFFFEVLKNLQLLRIFVTGYILIIPNISFLLRVVEPQPETYTIQRPVGHQQPL